MLVSCGPEVKIDFFTAKTAKTTRDVQEREASVPGTTPVRSS
jgi:hypothetical protein